MIRPNFAKYFDKLMPVIVQEIETNEILMHAYANEEAFLQTLRTKIATYYSRSRQEIWVKGATSGNTQEIQEIKIDCDEDTLLYIVKQNGGVACHEGYKNCFFRSFDFIKNDFVINTKK